MRTMVLRRFEPTARPLTLHTDKRAAKLSEIDRKPRVAVHVYDARAAVQTPPHERVALLLHEDDLAAETLPMGDTQVVTMSGFAVPEARSPAGCGPRAAAWVRGALADRLERASRHFSVPAEPVVIVATWADMAGCNTVINPYAPAGWTANWLAATECETAPK